eukprot:1017307-Amphidinium_carterae.1
MNARVVEAKLRVTIDQIGLTFSEFTLQKCWQSKQEADYPLMLCSEQEQMHSCRKQIWLRHQEKLTFTGNIYSGIRLERRWSMDEASRRSQTISH